MKSTTQQTYATTEQALCAQLAAFCIREGLPVESADELLLTASPTQQVWLRGFNEQWDRIVEGRRARRVHIQKTIEEIDAALTKAQEGSMSQLRTPPTNPQTLLRTGALEPHEHVHPVFAPLLNVLAGHIGVVTEEAHQQADKREPRA